MLFRLRTIPNAVKAAARALWAWALGRRTFVDPDEALRREAICRACPYYLAASGQCEVCTCFVSLKTKMRTEACPKRLW